MGNTSSREVISIVKQSDQQQTRQHQQTTSGFDPELAAAVQAHVNDRVQLEASAIIQAHENDRAQAGGCPVIHSSQATETQPSSATGCPVSKSSSSSSVKYLSPHQYNVYGQKIDPSNQMPAVPAQHAAAGQNSSLSTDRVVSSIPKAGNEGTWTYPSPQMFWNALVRKGKVNLMT